VFDRAPVTQPRQEPCHRGNADLCPPLGLAALFETNGKRIVDETHVASGDLDGIFRKFDGIDLRVGKSQRGEDGEAS